MNLHNHRLTDETFEEYRARLKEVQEYVKNVKNGIFIHISKPLKWNDKGTFWELSPKKGLTYRKETVTTTEN